MTLHNKSGSKIRIAISGTPDLSKITTHSIDRRGYRLISLPGNLHNNGTFRLKNQQNPYPERLLFILKDPVTGYNLSEVYLILNPISKTDL